MNISMQRMAEKDALIGNREINICKFKEWRREVNVAYVAKFKEMENGRQCCIYCTV